MRTLLKRGLPQRNVYTQSAASWRDHRHLRTRGHLLRPRHAGEVYCSTNQGNAWTLLASNLPPVISLEARVAG